MNAMSSQVFLKNEIELKVPLAIGTLQWGTTWVGAYQVAIQMQRWFVSK